MLKYVFFIYTQKNKKLHSNNIQLLNICLTQAKRVVAMKWKEQDKPQYNYWIKEMSATFALEKLTFIAKDKVSEFNKIWKSFMDFFRTDPLISPKIKDM